jgi:hypothetical protein
MAAHTARENSFQRNREKMARPQQGSFQKEDLSNSDKETGKNKNYRFFPPTTLDCGGRFYFGALEGNASRFSG